MAEADTDQVFLDNEPKERAPACNLFYDWMSNMCERVYVLKVITSGAVIIDAAVGFLIPNTRIVENI